MQKRADLVIWFKSVGFKTLDESWVRLHCQYDAVVLMAEDTAGAGGFELITDGRLTDERFVHYQNSKNPMNTRMLQTLQRAESCFDDGIGFAVIGDDVLMALFPGECDTAASIRKAVSAGAGAVCGSHPDFSTGSLDDENSLFIVEMQNRAICIIPNDTGAEEPDLPLGMAGRQRILDACRRNVIYGLAIGKKSQKGQPETG